MRFFKIRLRDGLVKCVKLKDEYEFSDYKNECSKYSICECYSDGSTKW